MSDSAVPATPGELLRKFQPRFRHIELVPQRFGRDLKGATNIYFFRPKHVGAEEEVHPNYYRDTFNHVGAFLRFDVQQGKLDLDFKYDHGSDFCVGAQLDLAGAKAILGGPLAHKFYIDLVPGHDLDVFVTGNNMVPYKLSWNGGDIPGLIPPKEPLAVSWNLFIPKGTKEYETIGLSADLYNAQKRLAAAASVVDLKSNVEDLSNQLTHRLKEVA